VARNFKYLSRRICKKLILELAGLAPASPKNSRRAGFIRARVEPSQNVRPAPNGHTYTKGCNIGEHMREGYWADDDT
jgi:hypothetical protein